MFYHYTAAHIVNIVCHIAAGTLATFAGLIAILARKRGRLHTRAGMIFVYAYSLVIVTDVLGVVIFEFRSFLAVAIIASAYSLFSGYRATRLRGRRPALLDRIAAMIGIAAPGLFIPVMHFLNEPWAPVLTWTVLGSLLTISSYDLLRTFLPTEWLAKTWIREHIFRIVGAFNALTATFAGKIFPQFQPWSAVVPHLFGTSVILLLFIADPRAWGGRPEKQPASPDLDPAAL